MNLKRLTGLEPHEKEEYDEWKNSVELLIENMVEILAEGLGLPTVGLEDVNHQDHGSRLKHLIAGVIGGSAMATRKEREPKDVKITLLIDTSFSMEGYRLNYAKLTLFALLEIIFELNDRLAEKGFQPIEFEVGAFSDDDDFMISHQSSELADGTKKERIIYDLMKKIVAGGGTDDVYALGRSLTRLKESPDRTSEGSRRLMFVLTDGNLGAGKRDEVKGIVADAEENNIAVFPIAIGDREAREQVVETYGKERAIIPASIKDLPREVLIKFADYLEPPKSGGSWLAYLPQTLLVSMFGLVGLVGQFVAHSFHSVFSSANHQSPRNLIQVEGYRHFFVEEVNGRSYLVFKKENLPELRWERGVGGSETPDTVVPDINYNERILLKIFQSIYRQDQKFSSYSGDGRYLIRYASGDRLEVVERLADGSWKTLHHFPPQGEKIDERESDGEKVFSSPGGVQWKGDPFPNENYSLELALNGDGFQSVWGWLGPNPAELSFVEVSKEKLIGFHPVSLTAYILIKGEGHWEVHETLQMEPDDPGSIWEGTLVELSGESGIGKGELLRAAANLMNEEIFFVPGNEDMEVQDLTEYRTMGVEKAGVSGYAPSIVAKVRHFGGWVVFDEIHKIKPKVLDALKFELASRRHLWREEDDEGIKRKNMVPDHPRARIFATSNFRRKGFAASGQPSDQAMQRRKGLLRMNWVPPNEEMKMQFEYAMTRARELGKLSNMNKKQVEDYQDKLEEVVTDLVQVAAGLRLTFKGYNAEQARIPLKEKRNRKGKRIWDKITYPKWSQLEDPTFKPANQMGLYLKRPPSPRVIKNILRHFVMYPKDLENRPWSVIQKYYTFSAEEDKNESYIGVKALFEGKQFKDKDENTTFYLRPESFQVHEDILTVTPVNSEGNPINTYEPVEIFLHPDAEMRGGILPENLLEWIKSSSNSLKLYNAIQALSLGKNLIFVGEQETGKSTLASTLARLISGPQEEIKPINYETSQGELKSGGTSSPVSGSSLSSNSAPNFSAI